MQKRFARLEEFACLLLRLAQRQQERIMLSFVRGTMAIRGVRQRSKQFESLLEMVVGFQVCPAMKGALTGALPVRNRLSSQPRLRVMAGDQLRLGLHHLRELRFEDSGYTSKRNPGPVEQGGAGGRRV